MSQKVRKRLALVWSVFVCTLIVVGCGADSVWGNISNDPSSASSGADSGPIAPRGCQLPTTRATVHVEDVLVNILVPDQKYIGDLLVLPPWNESGEQWCHQTRLCGMALERGFRLILPDMGKTVYSHAVYPETREDWRANHTIQWVKERLIPDMRNNYCLLKEDGQNFVLGASAGARGAILLLEELPDLFVAGAALSGDYNPAEMKGDNLYRGHLGSYEQFPDRWSVAENVVDGCSGIKASVYLGHGKADEMVPHTQTLHLYDQLKAKNPNVDIRLNLPADMGGDFNYWGSEVANVFDFFESMQASGPEGAMQ